MQGIIEFHNRNLKAIKEYNNSHEDKLPNPSYIVTKKFDGLSINLTYDENGILSTASVKEVLGK